MKIVFIGAGSASFGRWLLADVFTTSQLSGRGIELVLVDLDERSLARMTRLAERMNEHTGAGCVVWGTTDRRAALPGARYVIAAVSAARMALWEQDYRVPLALGFRHILGENGGPGALFHALRSLNLMVPIARDIEELAPDAWLLNFTNPEARVVHACTALTKVPTIGLCHGAMWGETAVAGYLGCTEAELDYVSAGINHLYAVLRATDRRSGADRLPELIERARTDPGAEPLFRRIVDAFGFYPFQVDDHIGEYLAWGSEYVDGRYNFGVEANPVPSPTRPPERFPTVEAIDDVVDRGGEIGRYPFLFESSGELALPIIVERELDRGQRRLQAVNVRNTDGYIGNLPRDAVVEVPATVDGDGLHPVHVGDIPEVLAAWIRPQITIHSLVTEAYATGDRRLLLQALLVDPVVNSIGQAERLLDIMLELQAPYLPAFS